MALTLALSFEIQNDNKLITITDTTTDYGVGGNIAVSAITAITLDVDITISTNVTTSYAPINLYALNTGPFATQSELIFELNPSMFLVGSVALGTASSEFPDGIYNFIYTVNTTNDVEYDVLMDGRVVNATYELLRDLPEYYNSSTCNNKEILDTIFTMGMIDAMESAAYVGNDDSILDQLAVIERLVTNGSNYTW